MYKTTIQMFHNIGCKTGQSKSSDVSMLGNVGGV